jgi:putative spermidine/putrescine transport system ATP-binding protein
MTTNADAGAAAATTAAAVQAVAVGTAGGAAGGAPVSLTRLNRHFGAVRALDGLTVDVAPGELVALLGPSGCGKTTALRILAGFETADSGTVTVDGKEISHVPASRRDMGMVFQSYSLFPNMSALDNVGFGLRLRKKSGAERKRRAGELLEMVGLAKQAGQYPHQLSGSSSGSRWPAHWPSSRGCCCWTSRCPRWTPRCGCSCGSRSGRCSSGWAPLPCSSRTIRKRRCPCPTESV